MANQTKSFLGRGWSFPPTFNPLTSSVVLSEEEEDIRESLKILISTIPGERVMQPLYGCDINSMVFKRMNTETIMNIKDLISFAIIDYEPRIDVEEIIATLSPHQHQRIDINIIYTIRSTNVRTNMVYPFYFLEGTDLNENQSL